MNKKKIVSLALIVCMIAILSFSSLAWFSDADEVTNKFMVASSGDPSDPDDIFSVDVKENIDTDGDGKTDTTIAEGDDKNGEEYEDILPGDSLVKEPFVVNTGAYDQYIRLKVTVTDATAWQEILAQYGISDLATIFAGYDDAKWIRVDTPEFNSTADTLTYTYYLQSILTPGSSETLFTHVVIPGELTQADLAKVDGSFDLTVKAEAVQTENVGDNALEAFTTVYGA